MDQPFPSKYVAPPIIWRRLEKNDRRTLCAFIDDTAPVALIFHQPEGSILPRSAGVTVFLRSPQGNAASPFLDAANEAVAVSIVQAFVAEHWLRPVDTPHAEQAAP
jgi:hypothetical protein